MMVAAHIFFFKKTVDVQNKMELYSPFRGEVTSFLLFIVSLFIHLGITLSIFLFCTAAHWELMFSCLFRMTI